MKQNYSKRIQYRSSLQKLCYPIVLLLISLNLIAQEVSIAGQILSASDNEPLQGVTTAVKGETKSTTTDNKGYFKISTVVGRTLIITSVGYQTQEAQIGNKTFLKVTLQASQKELEDVVVIGYGTQSRQKVIGSISEVTADLNC